MVLFPFKLNQHIIAHTFVPFAKQLRTFACSFSLWLVSELLLVLLTCFFASFFVIMSMKFRKLCTALQVHVTVYTI